MKIYEFENVGPLGKLVRTREIEPAAAVLSRIQDAMHEAQIADRDPNSAAIEKLCGMVAVLITRLPPKLADEALDYAYDIEG